MSSSGKAKYTTIHTHREDPGVYLVKSPFGSEGKEDMIDPGEAGVLFTGHSNADIEDLQGSGVFFSLDKLSSVINRGLEGPIFSYTCGFHVATRTCVWCGDEIQQPVAVKFQESVINSIFSDTAPSFHNECFEKFKRDLEDVRSYPEIVSHAL